MELQHLITGSHTGLNEHNGVVDNNTMMHGISRNYSSNCGGGGDSKKGLPFPWVPVPIVRVKIFCGLHFGSRCSGKLPFRCSVPSTKCTGVSMLPLAAAWRDLCQGRRHLDKSF